MSIGLRQLEVGNWWASRLWVDIVASSIISAEMAKN